MSIFYWLRKKAGNKKTDNNPSHFTIPLHRTLHWLPTLDYSERFRWVWNKIKLDKTPFFNDFNLFKEFFVIDKMYQTQIQVINPSVGNAKHFYYHCLTFFDDGCRRRESVVDCAERGQGLNRSQSDLWFSQQSFPNRYLGPFTPFLIGCIKCLQHNYLVAKNCISEKNSRVRNCCKSESKLDFWFCNYNLRNDIAKHFENATFIHLVRRTLYRQDLYSS